MDADADHDLLIGLNVKVDNLSEKVDKLIITTDTVTTDLNKMCTKCGMSKVKTDLAIEKTKTMIGWKVLIGIPSAISFIISLVISLRP